MGRKIKALFKNKRSKARGRNGGRKPSNKTDSTSVTAHVESTLGTGPTVPNQSDEAFPSANNSSPPHLGHSGLSTPLPTSNEMFAIPPKRSSPQPGPSGLCQPGTQFIQLSDSSDNQLDADLDELVSDMSSNSDTVIYELNEPSPEQPTAAARKINVMNTHVDISDEHGYYIIHHSFLENLAASMACNICKSSNSLRISSDYKGGMVSKMHVWCDNCEENVFSQATAPGGKRKDITKRLVLASKECGLGYEGLCKFFAVLNVKQPLHHKTYQTIASTVHSAAVSEAEKVMRKASEHVLATTTERNPGSLNIPATAISFDGTWHKRGHLSHFGVGVAIDCKSGLVLDTQTLSNYCHGCEVGPKTDDPKYITWRADHQCQRNFNGSSNAMEAETALIIFRRSVSERGLVYSKMLCDGDAKSHQKINNENVYDFEVEKEDCINHISKRMFNALEEAKKSNKKELNRKLTKTNIEKITNTYAANLKRSAPDTNQMKLDVYAGIYHMLSSDNNPQHHLCPEGEMSWCFFQGAKARGEEPRKHKQTLRPEVADFVWPIVHRLTDNDMLQRCSTMLTQNANECFNSLIWSRCPKTEFASRRSIETAVALSTIAYNCGPEGIFNVLMAMDIPAGTHHLNHSTKKLRKNLRQEERRTKRVSKWARKQRKRQRLQLEEHREAEEGPTYAAGHFNLYLQTHC